MSTKFSNRIADRSTCFSISEGRHESCLRETHGESASKSAEEAAQEVSELLLFDRFNVDSIRCLSLSSTLKLTSPARSNQSRSDQASRDDGYRRLGSCPCDEGHGRREKEREPEEQELSPCFLCSSLENERRK